MQQNEGRACDIARRFKQSLPHQRRIGAAEVGN